MDGFDAVVDDETLLEPEKDVRLVLGGAQVQLGLDQAAFESVPGKSREAAPVLEVVKLGGAEATGAEPGRTDFADNLAFEKGDEAVEFWRQAFDLEGTAHFTRPDVDPVDNPGQGGDDQLPTERLTSLMKEARSLERGDGVRLTRRI